MCDEKPNSSACKGHDGQQNKEIFQYEICQNPVDHFAYRDYDCPNNDEAGCREDSVEHNSTSNKKYEYFNELTYIIT